MLNLTPKLGLTNHNSNYSYSQLLTLILAVILYLGLLPAQSKNRNGDLAFSPFLTRKATAEPILYKTEELSFNS